MMVLLIMVVLIMATMPWDGGYDRNEDNARTSLWKLAGHYHDDGDDGEMVMTVTMTLMTVMVVVMMVMGMVMVMAIWMVMAERGSGDPG